MKIEPGDPSLPEHIAIIMDGNGRWAREQKRPRTTGHRVGAESVRVVVTECARLGIRYLTLYAFSVENWKRPKREVSFLMRLLRRHLVSERPLIMENQIRFQAIGQLRRLPKALREEIAALTRLSAENSGMTLTLALSYGGRQEIAEAAARLARDVERGKVSVRRIDEELFGRYLYTYPAPDPDLLIRTAGEMRVSNFLLWQISYAELYISPVCWPAFREAELHRALRAYRSRERKFGGVKERE
jgi:undecaprenyl diphosphate synthase